MSKSVNQTQKSKNSQKLEKGESFHLTGKILKVIERLVNAMPEQC